MNLRKTLPFFFYAAVGIFAFSEMSEAAKPTRYQKDHCAKLTKIYNQNVATVENLEAGLHNLTRTKSAYDRGITPAEKKKRIILKNNAVKSYNVALGNATSSYTTLSKECSGLKGITVPKQVLFENYNSWIKPI